MKIAGYDPGPQKSARVIIEFKWGEWPKIISHEYDDNISLLDSLTQLLIDAIAVEDANEYGQWYGSDSKLTLQWAARFDQAAIDSGIYSELITYQTISKHMCNGVSAAKDGLMNTAVRDRFEPIGGRLRKGTKKNPGPLYGFNNQHLMNATAVAITFYEARVKHETDTEG